MERLSNPLKNTASVVREMNTLVDPVHQNQPGAREGLLALSHRLIAMLETPSETIQRIAWAEVQRLENPKRTVDNTLKTWTDSI